MNHNHKKFFLITSTISILIGFLYFSWLEEWIIIRHPWWETYEQTINNAYTKHKVTISIWHNNQWLQEQNETIWSESDEGENTKLLTQATLTFLFEEEIIKKKVYVDAVLNTVDKTELIIIFDRNPFSKQMSIRRKYYIIESILKTLRENGIKTQKIRFLVNHQPLVDRHLDFLISWPLEGFLSR